MNFNYNSKLGPYIKQMVAQKHSVGYPYKNSERILCNFDRFCTLGFSDSETITSVIGDAWAVKRPSENPKSLQSRIAPIRELAKFMNHLGVEAYVIPTAMAPKDTHRYIPHIFTPDELVRFFQIVDMQPTSNKAGLRHLQLPVMFRLMYTCGLRPSEARLIRHEHINFSDGTILIPESKGHKDRMVVMTPEMTQICKKYYPYAVCKYPDSPYFFPCKQTEGGVHGRCWLSRMFSICWEETGLGSVPGNNPRPYDFRHTFATHRIYQWMKEKRDLNALLPCLSAYMGHSHFSTTAYYIHLVPGFFSEMSDMNLNSYGNLLPEVPHEI